MSRNSQSRGTRSGTIWSGSFITLTLSNFCNLFSQLMIITTLPLYSKALGASATLIGFVAGSFAITAIIFGPLASPAFDSFSKKKIFAGFIAFIGVLVISYSFVHSVVGLIVIRMLHGCAMGVTGPVALALVSEILPQGKVGMGISVFSLGQALAEALGPAAAIFIIGAIGYPGTFRVCACFMALGIILAFATKEPKQSPRIPYRFSFSRIISARSLPPAIVVFMLSAANACIISLLAIYGNLLGVAGIGAYFTIAAGMLLATRPIYGKLAERVGYPKIVILGLCFFICALVVISMSTQLWHFLCAAVVSACGYGACLPLIQAMCIQSETRDHSGTAGNTFFLLFNAAQFVGPFAAGAIVQAFLGIGTSEAGAYSAMYLILAGFVAISLIVFLLLRRKIMGNIEAARKADEAVNPLSEGDANV
ncbi:MAG: MFS transporter [bacterium]|nr:MFS transporter [bacterium]